MEHLVQVKQTYKEHFCHSMVFAFESMKASVCFFIHAIYPDVFQRSGSEIVKNLAENF